MSQWFNLEAALKTNGVIKTGMKEVIKRQLENALTQKFGEKKTNDANYRINTTHVD